MWNRNHDERIGHSDQAMINRCFAVLVILVIGLLITTYFIDLTIQNIQFALLLILMITSIFAVIDSFINRTLEVDVEHKRDIWQKLIKSFVPWIISFNLFITALIYFGYIDDTLNMNYIFRMIGLDLILGAVYLIYLFVWLKWYTKYNDEE
ncbi:hypothetical protein [Macrococcus psychrotolerans]